MKNSAVIAGVNSVIGSSIASEFLNRSIEVIGLTRKNDDNYFKSSQHTQKKFNSKIIVLNRQILK